MGIMPHPEHAVEELTGPSLDGLGFFTSVLTHLARSGGCQGMTTTPEAKVSEPDNESERSHPMTDDAARPKLESGYRSRSRLGYGRRSRGNRPGPPPTGANESGLREAGAKPKTAEPAPTARTPPTLSRARRASASRAPRQPSQRRPSQRPRTRRSGSTRLPGRLATPNEFQPYLELGLQDDEYARICQILGQAADRV